MGSRTEGMQASSGTLDSYLWAVIKDIIVLPWNADRLDEASTMEARLHRFDPGSSHFAFSLSVGWCDPCAALCSAVSLTDCRRSDTHTCREGIIGSVGLGVCFDHAA